MTVLKFSRKYILKSAKNIQIMYIKLKASMLLIKWDNNPVSITSISAFKRFRHASSDLLVYLLLLTQRQMLIHTHFQPIHELIGCIG